LLEKQQIAGNKHLITQRTAGCAMSDPKRPRVDDPRLHEEEPVAEVEEPDSLAEDYPAEHGDGLEGYGIGEGDPHDAAFNEAQSLQLTLETVSAAAGRHVDDPVHRQC
jgi:hypothetical protein